MVKVRKSGGCIYRRDKGFDALLSTGDEDSEIAKAECE